ncbi:cytochrome b N-terminal domain-containing protein [Nocardioides sp. NPDC004968]|uniref:cytochrome b n=1 Tax=Nocardioides sp. NPDC004968 TaxID=3155894 RepID=UPI0033BA5757
MTTTTPDERAATPTTKTVVRSRRHRLRYAETYGRLAHRAVPNLWAALFAAISAACLVVLAFTGILLTVAYDPSVEPVIYQGSYAPLRGVEVSRAYDSMLHYSLEVNGGLLVRQTHHWAALVLPASLMLQIGTAFFTGAFRRPRRLAWVLLVATFLLALGAGWSGYGLPDDALSGTGLRIFEGILIGTPFLGSWLTLLIFGGEFPSDVVPRLYWLHAVVIPVLLAVVLSLRLRLVRRTRPAQLPGRGRTANNLVGLPWPAVAARVTGTFLLTCGLLVAMGGLLTVAPIWRYGPASPTSASAGSQPDWYTAWLDGSLRLVPPSWDFSWLGHTWALSVLVPELVAAAFLGALMLYPLIEERVTGDRTVHHLLDRPRDRPRRTGLGVAGFVFFGILWLSASTDIGATIFHVSFETQVYALRTALVLGPVLAYVVTVAMCRELRARQRESVRYGYETGRLIRGPDGGYTEVHAPLSPDVRTSVAASARLIRRSDEEVQP